MERTIIEANMIQFLRGSKALNVCYFRTKFVFQLIDVIQIHVCIMADVEWEWTVYVSPGLQAKFVTNVSAIFIISSSV